MVKLLNAWSKGYIVVPILLSMRAAGIWDLLINEGLLFDEWRKQAGYNASQLHAVIHMLQSEGWLRKENNGKYHLKESVSGQQIPAAIISLIREDTISLQAADDKATTFLEMLKAAQAHWFMKDHSLRTMLDGLLLMPVILHLGLHLRDMDKIFDGRIFHRNIQKELTSFLLLRKWITKEKDTCLLTDTGKAFIEQATAVAPIIAAARLTNMADFRSEQYQETAVTCISKLFAQSSQDRRPRYIAEIGCGDGSFLKRLHEAIIAVGEKTGQPEMDPLIMIGVEPDVINISAARSNLEEVPHLLVQGERNDPDKVAAYLAANDIDTSEVLYVQLFPYHPIHHPVFTCAAEQSLLPHNEWQPESCDVFTPGISSADEIRQQLKVWAAMENKHGLILLERHCQTPEEIYLSLEQATTNNSELLPVFDTTSPAAAASLMMYAANAGLFLIKPAEKFPPQQPVTQVTLGHYQQRDYQVRYALHSDLPVLMQLENACWPPDICLPESEIKRRLEVYPEGQLVLEENGAVLGVIYSQRIQDEADLYTTTVDTVGALHDPAGKIVQLLSINIFPACQSRGLGDELLEFMHQRTALMKGVEKVCAITRSRDFKGSTDAEYAAYIRQVDEYGFYVDPIVRFHQVHGAALKQVVTGYRAGDKENLTNGILVTYDVLNRVPFSGTGPHLEAEITQRVSRQEVLDSISNYVAGMLTAASVEEDQPLMEMGLDSGDLMGLTLFLKNAYRLDVPTSFFFEYNTIHAVVNKLTADMDVMTEVPSHPVLRETDIPIQPISTAIPAPETMQQHLPDSGTTNDIAIIGMAFRVPGAHTKAALWDMLITGRSAITATPDDRWQWPQWVDLDGDHKGINQGGYLTDIDKFDAAFFRISAREAALMDPQQRLLLELTWELLEEAGYKPATQKGTKTGVYIGASGSDYDLLLNEKQGRELLTGTGTSLAILANRLSYFYDFEGPSLLIDTACASSLVAIDEAVSAIRAGKCTQAVVGGIHLMCHPSRSLSYYQSNMLSKDGRCKTFDESANGYVRAEGAVVLLLKPLSQAIADKDHVHGVIKGTAVNHGGQSGGLTVPNPEKQSKLLEDAYSRAGVDVRTVSYIEAHGTGTSLGDPIEIAGLITAFKHLQAATAASATQAITGNSEPWCGLGSVKSNMGHLEAAAGMAGILKVLLAMAHQQLPPTIHFHTLNPKIDLDGSPFYIQAAVKPWEPFFADVPLRAGVSSFGIGGANAHIVLEAFEQPAPVIHNTAVDNTPHIFVLSAKNKERLKHYAESIIDHIHKTPGITISGLCYTLQTVREEMEERLAFVCTDLQVLKDKLTDYITERPAADRYTGNIKTDKVLAAEPAAVNKWWEKRDLEKIAQYWCYGLAVDWQLFYTTDKPQKISLPGYPFARKRYWFDTILPQAATPVNNQPLPVVLDLPEIRPAIRADEKVALSDLSTVNLSARPGSREKYTGAEITTTGANQQQPLTEKSTGQQVLPQLQQLLKQILYLDREVVEEDVFQELGLDSILGVELIKQVNELFGLKIAAVKLYDYPTVKRMAGYIHEQLQAAVPVQDKKVQLPGVGYTVVPERTSEHKVVLEKQPYANESVGSKTILQELKVLLKNTLYLDDDMNEASTFQELGLDSILGVELIKNINEQFRLTLSATKLYDHPTLHALAAYIITQQSGAPVQEMAASSRSVSAAPLTVGTEPVVVRHTPVNQGGKELEEKVATQLKILLKHTLYLEEEMNETQTFQELGLDSILGVELIKNINEYFGLQLAATKLYHYPGLKELTAYIVTQLPVAAVPVVPVSPLPEVQPAAPAPMQRKQEVPAAVDNNITGHTEKIAIVGMSGRYPQAADLRAYWDNIAAGRDCVTTIEKDRWDVDAYYKAGGEKTGDVYSRWLGALEDIDKFDPLFFNISPSEAELMDPQHRILLEECWKSLEDAGYRRSQLDGIKCGTYVGIMSNEYAARIRQPGLQPNQAQSLTGNAHSIFAARIAYVLNLKGPAIAIDTACSSSLVAIHLACQALLQKETDLALAGGVSLYLDVEAYQQMCAAGMLSKEGKCKTFDNSADGFVPGEGAGVVVLKRLSDAVRDGDDIKGVILGTGINQDGKTNGITAPSISAQADLLKDIYTKYAIHPETISYVEAHGTGTKLGDPVEVEALTSAFNAFTKQRGYCGIGSVKSNLGHTSAAAGVAGLEKILLQFKHKKLAPSIHYREENEHLQLSASPFYVVTSLQDWEPAPHTRRRAALSSFGFSGTNAHLVVEEYTAAPATRATGLPVLMVLSARNTDRLKAQAQALKDFLLAENNVLLEDIAYTLQVGREAMEERLAFPATDIATVISRLADYLSGKENDLFIGNTRKDTPGILLTGEAGRAYITSAVQHHELPSLAQLWIKGVDIYWEVLYETTRPRKISLPTYAFARERYWIPAMPASAVVPVLTGDQLHPLLHRNNSTLKGQTFTSIYTGKEWFLADYKIGGEKVLPGAAQLELARAAGVYAAEAPVTRLTDITWLAPLRVNDVPTTVHIDLFTSEDAIAFEIYTLAGSTVQVYSQGQLHTTPLPVPVVQSPDAIRQRLPHVKEGAACYDQFKTAGLNYGTAFRGITKIYHSETEALSQITVAPAAGYGLIPGVLDSALQICMGWGTEKDVATLSLPYSMGEVMIYHDLPAVVWCYVRQQGEATPTYDIDLLGEEGVVLVRIKELILLPATDMTREETPVAASLYTYNWEESLPAIPAPEPTAVRHHIVLAGGAAGLADALQAALDVPVTALPTQDATEYFIQVLEIAQAKLKEKTDTHILIVCSNADYAEESFVSGLLQTAALERPGISGKVIGVDQLSLHHLTSLTAVLEAELYTTDTQVRYVAGKRMIKQQQAIPDLTSTPDGVAVKAGGVYLITGGAGGLGKVFATHLSRTAGTKLILTGRSELTATQAAFVATLPEAVYHRCDVSNKAAVAALITLIKTRYHRLDGIIHSAGVLRDSLIINKQAAGIKAVLAAKIQGTKNLDECTKEEPLDFMIFFSSVAGVLGNVGQADYAAANAFQDSYAFYRNEKRAKNERQGKTLSINWPLWQEGGMQIDTVNEQYLEKQWGLQSLPTTAGLQAFDALLGGVSGQATVMYGKVQPAASVQVTPAAARQQEVLPVAVEAGLSEKVTHKILEVAAALLKLQPHAIAVNNKLGSYGFDSISFTRYANELNNYYDLNLVPTVFYNHPTIADLTAFLINDHRDQVVNRHAVTSSQQVAPIAVADRKQRRVERIATRLLRSPQKLQVPDHTAQAAAPIAIVGISGRFPGAENLEAFWENIKTNKDLIVEVPADRWDWREYDGDPQKDKSKTRAKWGGFIKDADKFDPLFFNISPKEAALMDPQQRITLEAVYHALEDAGINAEELSGSDTGVFIGTYFNDYAAIIRQQKAGHEAQTATGLSHAILANRISYLFNLHGPSEPVDTACSSSLVAIHKGVAHIRQGACNIVIAGGVSLDLIPDTLLPLSQAGMLSETGRCMTFDQKANGYVRGEGVGIVILKSLQQAELDGDHIYGVILGTAENHGGRANTLTSPNPQAQKELLLKAYRSAQVHPESVSYIETHGTGTAIGDPIETEGLKLAFQALYEEHNIVSATAHCGIGSVKANIGHLEAAAGIAGVIKMLYALKYQTLPGNPHLEQPNTYLKLEGSPFYLQKDTQEWQTVNGQPRITGISSFGFGGANAHLIIKEYLPKPVPVYTSTVPAIVVLSAKNTDRLRVQVEQLKGYLDTHPDAHLYDVAYTLQTGREPMEERVAFLAADKTALHEQLHHYLSGKKQDYFTGNVRTDQSDFLLQSGAGKAYIKHALENKEPASLAQLWVKGVSMDWQLLYEGNKPQKISLPGYPFERKRYWVENKASHITSSFVKEEVTVSVTAVAQAVPVKTVAVENSRPVAEKISLSNAWDATALVKPALENDPVRLMNTPVEVPVNSPADIKTTAKEVGATLTDILRNTLYLEGDIDATKSFQELGLDSILGVEFIKSINEQFRIGMGVTRLYDYPNLDTLTNYIITQLPTGPAPVVAPLIVSEQPVVAPVVVSAEIIKPRQIPNKKELEAAVLAQLKKILSDTLYLENEIDESRPLQELGLDSILGVELIKHINEHFTLQLSVTKLYDYPLLRELAAYVTSVLPVSEEAAPLPVNTLLPPAAPAPVVALPEAAPVIANTGAGDIEKIAIIGMSGRYPKAANLQAYWDNIAAGMDCVTTIEKDRWDVAAYYTPGGEKTGDVYAKWLGALEDIDKFDPLFFNISPAEAELMDPQHRIFLEESWKSLEDAGYRRSQLDGINCGTYVGISSNEYAARMRQPGLQPNQAQSMTGNAHSIFAARIAYVLNLKGPAIAIDTACSGSLVAIHLACQALRHKETDMALAGGVSLYLDVECYQQMCAAGMLSKEGKCKTFDNSADGFVPGEGAGVVVLKRLSDAIRDGDDIKGVILGSGINQDGKTNGITAPSVSAQTKLLKDIYTQYHINPETISYVEAHGTGTKLGDPIEVEALTNAFGAFTSKKGYCGIGSVKSNLGHTSAAAGVAGLEKILLQFKHGKLAPGIHYRQENEHLQLAASPFYVVTALQHWETNVHPRRRAALSSFGFSGTNAHLVVEEYVSAGKTASAGLPVLIVLSARNTARLKAQVQALKDYLLTAQHITPEEVAYTLQTGREPMEERLAFQANDMATIINHLADYLAGKDSNVFIGHTRKDKPGNSLTEEVAEAALNTLLRNGELNTLAQLWVKGAEIPWEGLYAAGKPGKISLPTYPFARERYWIDAVPAGGVVTLHQLHPLLHANESDLTAQKYTSVFTGNETFLADHQVQSAKVFPGVAYLELAREGGTRSLHQKVTRLQDVTWPAALQLKDTATKVYTGFYVAGEDTRFRVYTGAGEQEQVHSEGRLSTTLLSAPVNQDLTAIRNRMTNEKDGVACYEIFTTLGLQYGPGFQGINKLYYNETAALSRITLPVAAGYQLSPGVLDSALQTIIGLQLHQGAAALSLPYSAGEVAIYQDLPATVWSYVRKRSDHPESVVTSYDIDILGDAGEVLVRITDFVTLPIGLQEKADSRMGLYTYSWEDALPVVLPKETTYSQHQILLAGGSAELAVQLQAALEVPVIALQAADAAAYFIEVWEKVKAILQTKSNTHLIVVGSHTGYVQYGCVAGLLQTATLEYPGISGKVISVDELSQDAITDLTTILAAELYTTDTQVRYEAGKRAVKRAKTASLTDDGAGIKAGGVYLITGGAGGVGKIFATHLSQTAGTKLILTGRSELTAANAAFVASLPDAIYHPCDVSNKAEVTALIAMIKTRYQQLDGIIHSAGVVRDSLIGNKQLDNIQAVLAAKIAGTYNLDECTKGENLDFLVFCSSVSAVIGNAGQADYAAGNAYQDHYAAYRQELQLKGERQGKTLSINWPLWEEGGMQVDPARITFMEKQWGLLPMPSADGMAAFTTLLRSGLSQGIVLYGQAHRLPELLQGVMDPVATVPVIAPMKATTQSGLKPAAIRFLQTVLSAELKIPADQLEPAVALEHYGIDSMLITRLTNRLDASFDRIPRTLFFEYQTLDALADYFVAAHPARLQALTGLDKVLPDVIPHQRQRFTTLPVRQAAPAVPLPEDIAIIGLSGRYPGAKNIAAFWEVLKAGQDCITEIPAERWPIAGFYDAEKRSAGKSYSKWGGFIADVDKFDPLFFNISPRDAELMDPQERLFLETVWETIEDAGYTRTGISDTASGKSALGDKVGVYVGVMYEEYQLLGTAEKRNGQPLIPGSSPGSIANRVSYCFNFHGPSMAVDTMCSSSLTAIHLACESIRNGHCEQAIAGGVNISIHPNKYLSLSQGRFVSASGRCESFGAGGEGYVPGEGVGAVLLKRLSEAIADGDQIYGVIKGTAINHGGKTNGYAVPNPKAQAAVIKAAMNRAGVQAADFSYIEAHGTGTSLGDPIEIAGLNQAFATTQQQYCSIGSVKSNIGHCESAAGISGLTKVLLQLKHQQLVPSLHAATLNPNIDFAGSPFKVQQQLEAWTTTDNKPRIAGISSFGAGGSNAHLIVAEYQPATTTTYTSSAPAIIVLSARDTDRLREQVTNLKDYLEQHPDSNLYEVAYMLQTGREPMEERLVILAQDKATVIAGLTDYQQGKTDRLLTANIKKVKLDFAPEGGAGQAYINHAMAHREYAALARLWVKGVNIGWHQLYDRQLPRKISLPTYPFARERYWIPEPEAPRSLNGNGKLHPLLHFQETHPLSPVTQA
ncbi:SDR family NAD(P)-dependent oxidoreductase [Chitinophaga nivalis]|uniref:SDR family NAD(P)-dependent oxidoreductase n=1 Tax=Chitinophaga nivalis TaxID=2991709 RepID=A0ABT3IKA1_9BACT|nr:SDR family NAD(P)-dependent oxidoreductase [Chitinophaga nivalis]MCW3465913.1 SDR family NAD(P)-dependent oxidoreductase [Chitinophaga nivalis]MCW3484396.1 SDR family NAD(P)-dependent oxidoreductase [Chitinophaga nivalis]